MLQVFDNLAETLRRPPYYAPARCLRCPAGICATRRGRARGVLASLQPRPSEPRTVQLVFETGTPVMSSNDAAESSRSPRRLSAAAAGLVGLLGAVLLSGMFEVSLPTPARAEVAAPAVGGLCFHGQGGELLDFAPAGQGCR
jgi:hypothetical protein